MGETVFAVCSIIVGIGMGIAIATCGAPKPGTLRGACYPNSTCNAGLECRSKVCVETAPAPEGEGEGEGGLIAQGRNVLPALLALCKAVREAVGGGE